MQGAVGAVQYLHRGGRQIGHPGAEDCFHQLGDARRRGRALGGGLGGALQHGDEPFPEGLLSVIRLRVDPVEAARDETLQVRHMGDLVLPNHIRFKLGDGFAGTGVKRRQIAEDPVYGGQGAALSPIKRVGHE